MARNSRYLYLTGGLGNQLFQYAFALSNLEDQFLKIDCELGLPVAGREGLPVLFEYKLNESVVLLDKRNPNTFFRKLGFFSIKLSSTTKQFYRKFAGNLLDPFLSLLFSLYYGTKLKVFISKGVGFSNSPRLSGNNLIIGYFQSIYWPNLQSMKNELLNLELKAPSEKLLEYQKLAQIEKPLVVHIRLGDYVAEKSFGIPSLNYYQNAIFGLYDRSTHKKIWVFTNDQSGALKLLPKEILLDVRWIPNVADSPAETLEVMRLGHDYVIGNSTYSWWGAFLSKNQQATIVAPSPWFKESKEPSLLCPENWQRIEAWPENK